MRARLALAVLTAAAVACGPTSEPSVEARSGAQVSEERRTSADDRAPEVPAREDRPPPQRPSAPPPPPELPPDHELRPGEPVPAAKRAAVELVQELTTFERDDTPRSIIAGATDDADLAAQLQVAAAPLFHEGAWSRGRIVYPQLGGLEQDAVAVITVVRQEVGHPDGTTSERTRVLDVRVERDRDGRWRVSELASAGGEPVARPDDLSAAAAAVLDDERIELPDTVRWDVHRGAVDESLLELMARMAERTPYGVVAIDTGHSREVFGSDPIRPSRHSEGRAVDVYRVGDRHVVEDRERGSATYELVRWLYDQPELAGVGSPWALDGFGGRSFSDQLHQDHLHVAVLRPGEEPAPQDLDESTG